MTTCNHLVTYFEGEGKSRKMVSYTAGHWMDCPHCLGVENARLTEALHAAKAHPDFSYINVDRAIELLLASFEAGKRYMDKLTEAQRDGFSGQVIDGDNGLDALLAKWNEAAHACSDHLKPLEASHGPSPLGGAWAKWSAMQRLRNSQIKQIFSRKESPR